MTNSALKPASGPVAAVVLAAGQSSRMGRNKQLLTLGGETLIARTVRQVLAAEFDHTLVVLGRDAQDVRAALPDARLSFTVNARFQEGLASSFQAGIQALPEGTDAAVFLLADMAFVTSAMYRQVCDAYRESGAPLVLARFEGVRAPPHLFRADLFGRFSQEGDHGPKALVQEFADRAVWLDFPGWALTDVDTPNDLLRARLLRTQLEERPEEQ